MSGFILSDHVLLIIFNLEQVIIPGRWPGIGHDYVEDLTWWLTDPDLAHFVFVDDGNWICWIFSLIKQVSGLGDFLFFSFSIVQ